MSTTHAPKHAPKANPKSDDLAAEMAAKYPEASELLGPPPAGMPRAEVEKVEQMAEAAVTGK